MSDLKIAEQSVLGAMILSPHAVAEVATVLTGSDFYVPRHEIIFDALLALHHAEHPTDVVALVDELLRTGELQRAGGAEYLHQLTSVVPTSANAAYYAGIVRGDAMRRRLVEIADRIRAESHDPAIALPRALADLQQLSETSSTGGGARARSLRAVLNVPAQEDAYDWVIPGVLERRDRLMLTGSEGGGKSTMLRQLALLSAAGVHPFGFHQIDPIRVLVVDAENSERQWRRAVRGMTEEAAQRGRRDPRDFVALETVKSIDITRATDLTVIHRRMDEVKPDLLLIGPLYRLVPRAIQSDDDAAPVLAALDSLRDRDVAMLIEAHAGHAGSAQGERDLRPRGSSALLGWPEFGLGLRREKPSQFGLVKFSLTRWRGDRDRRDFPAKFMRGSIWPWEPTVG